jgi:hypothetical protein
VDTDNFALTADTTYPIVSDPYNTAGQALEPGTEHEIKLSYKSIYETT